MEVAAGGHHELAVDLALGGIFGEGDLAGLLGRDMAELLVVLFPVPGLVVPGRRRIAAVGEAQLLADRPVDIADIGDGKRDTKLHTGRAAEHKSELQSLMRISYADLRMNTKVYITNTRAVYA